MRVKNRTASILFLSFLAVDLIHHILSQIFNPITGYLDGVLHILIFFGQFYYLAYITHMLVQFVDRVGFHLSKRQIALLAWLLALCLVIECFYAFKFGHSNHVKPVQGNDGYYMLWPHYFGGLALGLLVALLANRVFKTKQLKYFFTLLAQLWIAGPIVTDNMLLTAGGNRAMETSSAFFLSSLDTAYQMAISLPFALFPLTIAVLVLVLIKQSPYLLSAYKQQLNADWQLLVSYGVLYASFIVLLIFAYHWAGFILD